MQQRSSATTHFFLGFVIICAVIIADQYTKWLVIETMLRMDSPTSVGFVEWFTTQKKIAFFVTERESFKIITLTPFLDFVMVWNQGISFGMLDTPHMPLVLISTSTLISMLMILWLALTRRRIMSVALGLVVGGALANVMDRVRFGAVADFIDLHANGRHWPAFNVADSCIVLGALILTLGTLFEKDPNRGKK